MRISLYKNLFSATLVAAALFPAGCGDDANPSADTAPPADTASGADATTEGDTAIGTDTTTAEDTATGADSSVTVPPVFTAEITLNGVTSTVVPEVRRGFGWHTSAEDLVNVPQGNDASFTCAPDALPEKGGRIVRIRSVVLRGNWSCAANTGGEKVDAERDMKKALEDGCAGKSVCSVNPWGAFAEIFNAFQCQSSGMSIDISYTCHAAIPGPLFVFEAAVNDRALRFQAMDGLGSATCAERATTFVVDQAFAELAPGGTCVIAITQRTESSLAGTVTANLVDGNGNPFDISIDFQHDRNGMRPGGQINTGSDLCATSNAIHAIRTEGDDTIDVFTVGDLSCQAAAGTTIPGFELQRRRPRADGTLQDFATGGRINLARGEFGTTQEKGGFCRGAVPISEEGDALRFVFFDCELCNGNGNCAPNLPVVMLQFDLATSDAR